MLQAQSVSQPRISDMRVHFPSGHERYIDITWTSLRDQQGYWMGLVAIFRDVTERHHKEYRIRHAFHLLSSLMEEMVHLPCK
ncbi:PAS domain-containing protein [Dictyobacter kobayashii]|uniref:PAC domain-containing protein n=1 Tax=Dictyobacter kobayashii TaxID=2014872 RepID=A0A402ARW6_9CHLR|nr:PAS domain-containing protein [Dictyobacter kobayashii]GCE21832.1 hypothetical protein KDK_56320 [Dictyobacter kobayashii]